jgi:S-adenosylmethionine:tRNA ribosyltransferase-isomerase
MRLEDFDYPLDESLIAQHPIEPRDQARLLVLDRESGAISHSKISALSQLLSSGDLLVFNNTQVFPARLFGTKHPSGGKVELLLVRAVKTGSNAWEVMIRGKIRPGQQLELPQDLIVTVLDSHKGTHVVSFPPGIDVFAYAEKAGLVPLPPYIRRAPTEADRDRYQTIFARTPGAVAAPTAGLHFTRELLHNVTAAGVRSAMVTLHVGPGTFKPVTTADICDHKMDAEYYELPEETVKAVENRQRIIAVGSTSVRVLETAAGKGLPLRAGSDETNLFIYPGYDFKLVEGMLTNFHLPKSTLLMLVCAFAGRERVLEAYRVAAAMRYRFFSYGDAMLIL